MFKKYFAGLALIVSTIIFVGMMYAGTAAKYRYQIGVDVDVSSDTWTAIPSSSSINWASHRYVSENYCALDSVSCIFLGDIIIDGNFTVRGDIFNVSVVNYNVTGTAHFNNIVIRILK